MAKVKSARILNGYSGKLDGVIYYTDKKTGITLARRTFKFHNHPAQPGFRTVQKQIYAIQPSPGYKQNLKDYILLYNKLPENSNKQITTWTNAYNKLMYNMQKADPVHIDLKIITRQQIQAQNLPCRTVKAAIEAGLLPTALGYEKFTAAI